MGGKKGGLKKAVSLHSPSTPSVQVSPPFFEESYLRRCWENTREQWGGHQKVELGAGFIAAIAGGISGILYAGFTWAALGGVVVGAGVGFIVGLLFVFLYSLSLSPKRLDEQGQKQLASAREELLAVNHALESKSAEYTERLKEWHTLHREHLELREQLGFSQNSVDVLERDVASLQRQLDDRATRAEHRQALTLLYQAGEELLKKLEADAGHEVDSLLDGLLDQWEAETGEAIERLLIPLRSLCFLGTHP